MEQMTDKTTIALFRGKRVKAFEQTVAKRAKMVLGAVLITRDLRDLQHPSLRLEKLPEHAGGNTYSVRINKKWRVQFRWVDGMAVDIIVIDYH